MCYTDQPGQHMQRESEEMREREIGRRKVKKDLEREKVVNEGCKSRQL